MTGAQITDDGSGRMDFDLAAIDNDVRQACTGIHLANPAASGPFRITEVESKGKRNRRIRFVLD